MTFGVGIHLIFLFAFLAKFDNKTGGLSLLIGTMILHCTVAGQLFLRDPAATSLFSKLFKGFGWAEMAAASYALIWGEQRESRPSASTPLAD